MPTREPWREATVGECAQIVSGGTPSKGRPEYWGGDIPWITAKDMTRFTLEDSEDHLSAEGALNGTRFAPAGSTLVLVRGMTLHQRVPIGFAVRDLAFNQDLKALIPAEGVHPRFLAYAVLAKHDELLGRVDAASHGTGRLNTDALRDTKLLVPRADEQGRVARALGCLDDKIDLNRRIGETLEKIGRALFKSWFVDFDPVRGTATVPQNVRRLFPSRLVDSLIGPVPERWDVVSVYDVADVEYGAPFASSRFNDRGQGLPLVRIRDLPSQDPKVYTSEDHPRQVLLEPGDIAVGMDGEFRAHLWHGPKSLLNQRLCAFRPKKGVSRGFLLFTIRAPLAHYEHAKSGTTVIHLGKADIDRFRILRPPPDVMAAFGEIVEPCLDSIVALGFENTVLAELRDTVMPKLISGTLRLDASATRLAESLEARVTGP